MASIKRDEGPFFFSSKGLSGEGFCDDLLDVALILEHWVWEAWMEFFFGILNFIFVIEGDLIDSALTNWL